MKRLILLLVVLAGGLAAAAFAIPSKAASVNGVAISNQNLSSDLTAIAKSSDYQCFLNAEEAVGTDGQRALPPIAGTAQVDSGPHSSVGSGFASTYLDTLIGHQLVLELAATKHVTITPSDLSRARAALETQINAILAEVAGSKFACGTEAPTGAAVLATMPSSFVDENVQFDATVSALEEDMAGVGSSSADLQRYYTAHSAAFDTACFTVAQYSSQSDAAAAVATVNAGTPFSQVAAQVSGGGPAGCAILASVASELPAGNNLEKLALNTVSNPIAANGAYLVIEITQRTPTSYAKAATAVASVVQSIGATKTQTTVDAAEKTAVITVDRRYGDWERADATLLPLKSPLPVDVLNPSVNGAATTVSKSPAPTGQTP